MLLFIWSKNFENKVKKAAEVVLFDKEKEVFLGVYWMGNKLGRKRQVVDEQYTRPQGLYNHKDVDIKRLRKLILESKLAPCYPGDEECGYDLEECPICFLYYPSLNRSRCCMKGICTECFLQMKVPNSARPTQCPFCKMANYAVEYRGVKTKEEKGIEQIEEQRVIEAKIRMRQKELQDEEERMLKRQNLSSSSRSMAPADGDYSSAGVPSRRYSAEGEDIISADDSDASSVSRQHAVPRANRDDEFDLDLEEIMVMEAIWRSIQENGKQRGQCYSDTAPSEHYISEDRYVSPAAAPLTGSSSPSSGLACAIAALAERQQMSGESDVSHSGNVSTYNTAPSCSQYYRRVEQSDEYCPVEGSMGGLSQDGETPCHDREWNVDHGSEVAEAGTSYASSDSTEDAGSNSAVAQADEVDGGFQNLPAPIIPESFEDQMMLAMAVSLAETRVITSGPGVAWQ